MCEPGLDMKLEFDNEFFWVKFCFNECFYEFIDDNAFEFSGLLKHALRSYPPLPFKIDEAGMALYFIHIEKGKEGGELVYGKSINDN